MDLGLPVPLRSILRFSFWIVVWPLLALAGAAVVAAVLARSLFRLVRLRTVARQVLRCPAGHRNGTAGRWECARCGGQFAGWVGRCCVCGDEEAEWFPCGTCGLAVVLPWRKPL